MLEGRMEESMEEETALTATDICVTAELSHIGGSFFFFHRVHGWFALLLKLWLLDFKLFKGEKKCMPTTSPPPGVGPTLSDFFGGVM